MSKQPRDAANAPIPVLSYRPQTGQALSFSETAVLSAPFALSTRVISIYTTADCKFELGDDTVIANTANSHFLPTGVYADISLGSDNQAERNARYISVIRAGSTNGTIYISERE
jgi:hypothetical protein